MAPNIQFVLHKLNLYISFKNQFKNNFKHTYIQINQLKLFSISQSQRRVRQEEREWENCSCRLEPLKDEMSPGRITKSLAKYPGGWFPSPLSTLIKALINTRTKSRGKKTRVCPTCQGVSGENLRTKIISGLLNIPICDNKVLIYFTDTCAPVFLDIIYNCQGICCH